MDLQRRCLGVGSVLIVTAVILRLLSAGAWQTIAAALEAPETAAFVLYLETGRIVRPEPEPSTAPTLPQSEPQPRSRPGSSRRCPVLRLPTLRWWMCATMRTTVRICSRWSPVPCGGIFAPMGLRC